MTPDYKFYLMGKLRGLEKALNIVNRRDVDSATVKWLVREIKDVKSKMEEEVFRYQDRLTIPISEHDIELFKELVDEGDSFSWNFDGVDVTFVKQEEEE